MTGTAISRATQLLAVAGGMCLAACQPQGTSVAIATEGSGAAMDSWLGKPEGEGPFPAVVLAHGCSGTERNTPHQTVWRGLNQHAAFLNRNGFVTLILDSFGPRGITDGCHRPQSYYPVQMRDAHDAADFLTTLEFVDKERIGLVGLSLGGGTALRLAQQVSVDDRTDANRATFSAFVAYYPYCDVQFSYSLARPVLVMVGSEDNWTPAHLCISFHANAEKSNPGQVLQLVVYPAAHHSFDLPMEGPYHVAGDFDKRYTVAGNPQARQDSRVRMLEFFRNHLTAAR